MKRNGAPAIGGRSRSDSIRAEGVSSFDPGPTNPSSAKSGAPSLPAPHNLSKAREFGLLPCPRTRHERGQVVGEAARDQAPFAEPGGRPPSSVAGGFGLAAGREAWRRSASSAHSIHASAICKSIDLCSGADVLANRLHSSAYSLNLAGFCIAHPYDD